MGDNDFIRGLVVREVFRKAGFGYLWMGIMQISIVVFNPVN